MLLQTLMNPKVANVVSRLDDTHSMFSIATRDFVDNAGRTVMEWKRSPEGGKERLIEEAITTVIWGFGINFMKERIYDPFVKKFANIPLPDLDAQILNQAHPQALSPEMAKAFEAKMPEVYKHVREAITTPALQAKYHASNVAKFALCTFVPVALLAFGVPRFNQWLTRNRLAKQKNSQAPQFGLAAQAYTPLKRAKSFSAFEQAQAGYYGAPTVQFGNSGLGRAVAETASLFLQNERANTLLVDGTLSTGRAYSARNWLERMEIIFREATIIGFLFFAQRPIQNWMQKHMDKLFGTTTQMEFNGLTHLKNQLSSAPHFDLSADFQKSWKELVGVLAQKMPTHAEESIASMLKTPGQGMFSGVFGAKSTQAAANASVELLEKPLVEVIREFALAGKADNLILEMAKSQNLIKTMAGANGEKLLDLTKMVNTKEMPYLIKSLESMAQKLQGKELGALASMVNKSYMGRFSAMILANAVCAFFVAYLGPKVQHWLTYKMTGKDYFPGVEPQH
jgi:hypothetical protein